MENKNRIITAREVIGAVEKEFRMSWEEIVRSGKERERFDPRMIGAVFVNQISGVSTKRSGAMIDRDHSTINHCKRKFAALYVSDLEFRKSADSILKALGITEKMDISTNGAFSFSNINSNKQFVSESEMQEFERIEKINILYEKLLIDFGFRKQIEEILKNN